MDFLADSIVIAVKAPLVIGKCMVIFAKGDRQVKAETRTAKAKLASSSVASLSSGKSLSGTVQRYRQLIEAKSNRLQSQVCCQRS